MTDTRGQIAAYRGCAVAVQLARAHDTDDTTACEKIMAAELERGYHRELIAGLATIAVSVSAARTAHQAPEDRELFWQALADRYGTAIIATAEIDQMTTTEGASDHE